MNYKALTLIATLFGSQLVFADIVSSPTDIVIPLVILGILGAFVLGIVVVGVAILYFVYKYVTKQDKTPKELSAKVKKKK